MRSSLGGRVKR